LGRTESDSFNPYTAPLTEPETFHPFTQADTPIRRQFIDCESNIRSIASVLIFGGIILMVCGVASLYFFGATVSNPDLASALVFLVLTMLGFIQLVVGLRVLRFRPGARIGAIIFSVLWLLFFPVGTIFGGACLWYLVRPAAAYVFTKEYNDVILKTPHVRFQTSAVSWGILALVLLSVLGLVVLSTL